MAKVGTTRHASNQQEKRIQKTIGGRKTKNSGAGREKGDILLEDFLLDGKTSMTSVKSKSVKKEELDKAREQAFFMRKRFFAVVLSLGDGVDYGVLPLDDLATIYEGFKVYEKLVARVGLDSSILDEHTGMTFEELKKYLRGNL
jgi:hypothetical protein